MVLDQTAAGAEPPLIQKYRERLPVTDATLPVLLAH